MSNPQLFWDNLVAYSMQIGLLVGLAAFVPTLLRLRLPAARLAYWHLLLGACLLLPVVRPWKQSAVTMRPISAAVVRTPVVAQPAPMPAAPFTAVEIVLLIMGAGMLIRLCWLASGFWRLACMRRHSVPLEPASSWGVEADILVSETVSSPVTFGLWRPTVLLPANFPELEASAQEAILCHEVFHVRRRDWLFTLGEELVRSVFWFHPAIWWLLGEIGLAREQVVDREVVDLTRSRDEYLDALLAVAGAPARLDLAPAPLFLRRRHLRQRVASIMKEVRMSKTRFVSSLAAGLGFLAVACWLVTATFPLAAAPQTVADGPGVTVDSGGAVMHRTAVKYPDAARRTHVQGVVTVEAAVDSSGNVVETRVLNGPVELRRAAQESVLAWHFATDSGMNTRTVKVTFDLPAAEAALVAAASPAGAVLEAARRAAVDSNIQPEIRALLEERIKAATAGSTATISTRTLPATTYEGKRINAIYAGGLSAQTRADLLSRLPLHVGDTLAADSLERARTAVREFDEHLSVGIATTNQGEVILNIQAPGASGGVLGSVIASMPAAPAPPPPPPLANGVRRITIGGNVQQAKLVSQPKPMYPPLAKQAHISGVVNLKAVIGTDGSIINLTVISGHPILIEAALDAVQQWKYAQTLLNGEPVEVSTDIQVNFTLSE